MPEDDFMMMVLICAPVAFLFIGGMCWVAYYFMKRSKRATAVRDALLVFTGLVVGVSAVSAPEAAKKMERRKQFLGRDENRKGFIEGCLEANEASLAMLKGEIENPEQALEELCSCMYDKMEADPEVSEMLNSNNTTREEINSNRRVKEIRNECNSELLKKVLQ